MSFFRSISAGMAFLTSASSFGNFRVEQLATDPTKNIDKPGRIWYNTTEKTYKVTVLHHQSGSVVIEAAPTRTEINNIISTAQANTDAISALQTANTNTIGGLGTTYLKLDGTGQMAGPLDFGTNRAVNVGTATATTDGVNKGDLTTAITTATAGLVSTNAMNAAITTAMSQHISGAFKFGGVVTTGINTYTGDAVTQVAPYNITDIGWVPDATGQSAGYVFSVRSTLGHENTTIGWFSLDGTTIDMVEAKVGDDLIIGTDGKLYVDDNTNSQITAANGYVNVTGSSTIGYTVGVSSAVEIAADNAVLKDGTRAMTGALDMGNHVINNVQQAATKFETVNLGQLQNIIKFMFSMAVRKSGAGSITKKFTDVYNGTIVIADEDFHEGGYTKHGQTGEILPDVAIETYVNVGGNTWEPADVHVSLKLTPNTINITWNADVSGDYLFVIHPGSERWRNTEIAGDLNIATNLAVV